MVALWAAVALPAVVAGILTKNYLVVVLPILISGLGIFLTAYVPSPKPRNELKGPLPSKQRLALGLAAAGGVWIMAWLSFNLRLDCGAGSANSIGYRALCDFAFWGDYLGVSRTVVVGCFLTLLGALCVFQGLQQWRSK
jgi:hypothetical protein